MQQIVIATANKGKISEIQQVLSALPWELIPQSDLKITSAPENGLTFVENALLKARHAARLSGLPVLADDSGLLVEALGSRPGIYSSRYAGVDTPYQEKAQRLLQELSDSGSSNRSAYFFCVMVFLRYADDPTPLITQGKWQGELTDSFQGENGFGYDPIFYLPELQCTAAQLSSKKKNSLSHRAQALQEMSDKLDIFL